MGWRDLNESKAGFCLHGPHSLPSPSPGLTQSAVGIGPVGSPAFIREKREEVQKSVVGLKSGDGEEFDFERKPRGTVPVYWRWEAHTHRKGCATAVRISANTTRATSVSTPDRLVTSK